METTSEPGLSSVRTIPSLVRNRFCRLPRDTNLTRLSNLPVLASNDSGKLAKRASTLAPLVRPGATGGVVSAQEMAARNRRRAATVLSVGVLKIVTQRAAPRIARDAA